MNKFLSVLYIVFALGYSVTSWAVESDLAIEITQGIDEPTPVAVVPFSWSGSYALSEDIAAVVSADLGRTGIFAMMDRKNMLSFPVQQDQVFYRDWRASKQDYILIGRQIPLAGDQLKVEFELYDIVRETRLLDAEAVGSRNRMRDIAHYIADEVYQKLTGIRGAFSTRIVYVTAHQLGGGKGIYRLKMADSDGHNPITILERNEPIMSPAWSMDASKLAYVSFESGKPAIYIQQLATGKRQKLQSFPGLNGAPSWSPDGNRLALVLSKDGNPEVYVLDLRSYNLTRITHHYGIDTEPSWSPDGQSLIFTSDRGGQPQIYRIHLPTRQLERVTYEGKYNARGRLTEDGRFLAMVHQSSDSVFHIAVQDLKTGRLEILTDTYLDESPTIAPNGSIILYATQKGVKGVLGGVTLDGNVRFILPSASGDVREPAWSPYLK